MNGWLIYDKPAGVTSNKAIMEIKRLIKPRKIGHAGTLDPFATGILLVAINEATKTSDYAMGQNKEYDFEITWGQTRDSHDIDGAVTEESDIRPTSEQIEKALEKFTGTIEQVPPEYSAIKIGGKRACDIMRAGKTVELKSRKVKIHSLELLEHKPDASSFKVKCSKGFYIRSLARDIAKELGACGYVSKLRRTAIGPFTLESAISLDYIEKIVHTGDSLEFQKALMPLEAVLDDILVQQVTDEESKKLRFGQCIISETSTEQLVIAKNGSKAVAICERKDSHLFPKRVFNH